MKRVLAAAASIVLAVPAFVLGSANPASADPNIGRLVGVAIIDDVGYLVYEVPNGYRFVPID